jgi:purine-nucleoside phosphorylase
MSTTSDSSALTAEGTAAYQHHVEEAASALRSAFPSPPTLGILHDVASDGLLNEETIETTVPYADLPHAPGSGGSIAMGGLDGTPVVELGQHLHLYDGHTPREVAFPVRMLAAAGVETLLLTAAAGSVNPQFGRGDLMLLTDHINFQGQNPLVGPNVEDWGPRFPDMTDPYDAALQRTAGDAARTEGISLQKGIYLALLGPNEETTAEHRMARRLGADAVGTSVVPEVIAARHMDLRVMVLALLTEQHLTDDGPPASAGDGTSLRTPHSRLHRLLAEVVARLDPDGSAT